MDIKKAELREKIAKQRELNKFLDQQSTEAATLIVSNDHKGLENSSAVRGGKYDQVKKDASRQVVQNGLHLLKDNLQQQKLKGTVLSLSEADIKKLVQTKLYGDLVAYMENYLKTRSVGALQQHLETSKAKANDIQARSVMVGEAIKNVQDLLATADDPKKLEEIIERRVRTTKLINDGNEKLVAKRQRLQIVSKKKEELMREVQKQEQKLNEFRVIESIEEAEMNSVAGKSSDKKKAGGK